MDNFETRSVVERFTSTDLDVNHPNAELANASTQLNLVLVPCTPFTQGSLISHIQAGLKLAK